MLHWSPRHPSGVKVRVYSEELLPVEAHVRGGVAHLELIGRIESIERHAVAARRVKRIERLRRCRAVPIACKKGVAQIGLKHRRGFRHPRLHRLSNQREVPRVNIFHGTRGEPAASVSTMAEESGARRARAWMPEHGCQSMDARAWMGSWVRMPSSPHMAAST